MARDEAGIDAAAHEIGMGGRARQEARIGFDRPDLDLPARRREAGRGFGPRWRMDDQLGQHGIVVGRDLIALFHAGIDTNAGGEFQVIETARSTAEIRSAGFSA